jgi:hypothetical protein
MVCVWGGVRVKGRESTEEELGRRKLLSANPKWKQAKLNRRLSIHNLN